MSVFIKHYKASNLLNAVNIKLWRFSSSTPDLSLKNEEDDEFRVLDILKKKQRFQRRTIRRTDVQPDRTDRMPTDQILCSIQFIANGGYQRQVGQDHTLCQAQTTVSSYLDQFLKAIYRSFMAEWVHFPATEAARRRVTTKFEEKFRVPQILGLIDCTHIKIFPPPGPHGAQYKNRRKGAHTLNVQLKWGDVWPGPKTFHPSSVPLPLRQGYVPRGQAPPSKKANAELMKIPNFLHLTPPVIKMQCEAIKKFCTPWPKLLNSEEAIEKHYPIEIITSDYCHASPSIRNPLARIVSLRVKLSDLKLDKHARDKFLRLIGDRYDQTSDLVTITAERCPLRKQNFDYVNYLLTATYYESQNVEEWEKEKAEDDMEYYDWDNNVSKRSLINWYLKKTGVTKDLSIDDYKTYDISCIEHSAGYKDAVSSLFNDGESEETVQKYDEAVRKLVGLPGKLVES